jgi:hypothetical protein
VICSRRGASSSRTEADLVRRSGFRAFLPLLKQVAGLPSHDPANLITWKPPTFESHGSTAMGKLHIPRNEIMFASAAVDGHGIDLRGEKLEYWSTGVLEYWSIGKRHQLLASTPILQYSNTPAFLNPVRFPARKCAVLRCPRFPRLFGYHTCPVERSLR